MARITSGKSLILSEALETAFRVDELKKYAKLLCDNVPIRKAEVVAELTMTIFRDLEKLLKKLSPLYSMILSDMLHNFRGEYRRSALAAKYESHLLKEDGTDYPLNSEIFSLFVIYEWVPVDLRDKLLKILPEPPEETIRHENDLPADLTVRETAEFALANLSTMLRLVEEKRLKVSAKTGKASVATMRNLNSVLAGGDFYEQEQGVEDIQSFAWPLLLQGGGMVKKDGAVLTLTPAGRRALKGNLAQSVETMFGKWQKYKLHDEFSRVTAVKGQKSAGGRTMTTPPKRRWVINIELSTLETGKWVAIEEFDRHIRADGLDFDMVNYNWKLYFVNKQYGAIDYCDTWKILQFRYLLIYMFEYLATLGMFDVAYENPENARRDDYYECWGADDLPYLSHCDGLRYIRLNELGAFVLGLSDEYVPKNTTEGGYEVRNTEFIFVGGGMPSPT
ncbi:MAG: hypothetical protein OEM02_16120, partial [Desulfobulbaceae bacterium]|nr:hypothetical protein [Desulfobulbaceae bacterium]